MEAAFQNRRKLLIVDDAPSNLMMLGETLKSDYEIIAAASGEEALEKTESAMPDLILLDIMLPGIDGYEVCRIIKDNPETRSIPVIFITSKDTEYDEIKGLSAGAVDYVTKPFKLAIVKARVKTHIDLKQKTDILESLSFRDGLTGLYNRRRYDTVISAEWARAIRYKRELSLILLDIDYFKLYNDNYGHLPGDEALIKVSKTITETFRRANDFAARYGGEEFAVILADTIPEEAVQAAESMRKAVEDLGIEHAWSAASSCLTVSLGVSSASPVQNSSFFSLMKAADKALYEAKHNGKNRVAVRKVDYE